MKEISRARIIGIPIQMKQKLTLNLDESKKHVFIRFKLSRRDDDLLKRFFKLSNWKILLIEYPKTRSVTKELLQNIAIVPKSNVISGFGIHAMALFPSRMYGAISTRRINHGEKHRITKKKAIKQFLTYPILLR